MNSFGDVKYHMTVYCSSVPWNRNSTFAMVFCCTCQKLPPLTNRRSCHVFCEDLARVKKMLQHSRTEMELFFIPPTSILLAREVGTGLSKSRKTGSGWESEGKEDEYQTKSVVWAQNEGRKRRTSYCKGWDEREAELELGVGRLESIEGGCKNQECRGWFWIGKGE